MIPSRTKSVVLQIKNDKSTGPYTIPDEVWKSSGVTNNEIYFFLKHVWGQEWVTKTLVLCVFIIIYPSNDTVLWRSWLETPYCINRGCSRLLIA